MKTLFSIIMLFFLTSTAAQGFRFDYNTRIKNAEGKLISLREFDKLMDSKKWTLKAILKESKELDYIQLIKKTEADIAFEEKINPKEEKRLDKNAPNFEAIDTNGNSYSLTSLKGKIIFLHYWLTNIKHSHQYIPDFNQLFKKYKASSKIIFLSISATRKDNLDIFLKTNTIDLPIILNPHKTFKEYPQKYPNYILINQRGEFEFVTSRIDVNILERDIDRLLKK